MKNDEQKLFVVKYYSNQYVQNQARTADDNFLSNRTNLKILSNIICLPFIILINCFMYFCSSINNYYTKPINTNIFK